MSGYRCRDIDEVETGTHREVLLHLAERLGVSLDLALQYYAESGKRQREVWKGQAQRRQAEKRRRAAGAPVYRPRADYVGGPAR